MSQLTLSDVVTFVHIHIPDYPQAKIGAAVNLILEEVYERLNEIGYSTFTTRAPTTTGTVSVTNGSTTATFSSGVLLAADAFRVVQIGDDVTWYVVTRNAADTAGVLSSGFAGATNATAAFRIYYPTVTFPAGVGQILEIKRESDVPLQFAPGINPATIVSVGTVGAPRYFAPYSFDDAATPNDAVRVILRPFPNAMYGYEYQFIARPTLIDPDTVTPSTVKVAVPTTFRQPLLFGVLTLCWLGDDQELSDRWSAKAENAFKKALAYGGQLASGAQRQGVYAQQRGFTAYQNRPGT